MAATTTILVPIDPRDIDVYSITSEVAGHPIEYGIDRNLNTYWQATSTSQQDLIIDIGSSQAVQGIGLFARNYDVDLSNSETATIVTSYSDTGTSGPWTQFTAIELDIGDQQTVGKPLILSPIASSAQSHRYWRLQFMLFNPVIQLSQLFLITRQILSIPNARPEIDSQVYAQHAVPGPIGRQLRSPINMIPVIDRQRSWLISASADMTALQAIFDGAAGQEQMIILQPSDDDPEVVEIRNAAFVPNQLLSGIYQPSLTFRSVPYIEASEVF